MFTLEAQVDRMLPLIDSELECIDRHHAKLTQLSTSLVEAINMYHTLMRESDMISGNYNQTAINIQSGQNYCYGVFQPQYANSMSQMSKLVHQISYTGD